MPSSHPQQINEIVETIKLLKPKSVLDIGVGFGKYGMLAREYLELWDEGKDYDKRDIRIDGIEAFEKYITDLHKYIYDNIYTGNALDVLPNLEQKYDLILIIDVLEHFSYEEGMKLLKLCKEKGKNILISIPKEIGHQDAIFENKFEEHKFQFEQKHISSLGDTAFIPNEASNICILGENVSAVRKYVRKKKNRDLKQALRNRFPFLVRLKRTFGR